MTRLSDTAEAIRQDLQQAVEIGDESSKTRVCVGIYPDDGVSPEDEIPAGTLLCVTAVAYAFREFTVHSALARRLRKYRSDYDISLQVTGHQ